MCIPIARAESTRCRRALRRRSRRGSATRSSSPRAPWWPPWRCSRSPTRSFSLRVTTATEQPCPPALLAHHPRVVVVVPPARSTTTRRWRTPWTAPSRGGTRSAPGGCARTRSSPVVARSASSWCPARSRRRAGPRAVTTR